MRYPELWPKLLLAFTIFICILLLGYLLKIFIISRLKKFAEKTKWRGDDVIIDSLSRFFIWYFVILGLFVSDKFLEYDPDTKIIVEKALLVLTILVFTLTFARLTSKAVGISASRAEGLATSSSILKNISYVVVFVFGATIMLNTLGISITPIITALGIGGLAVALALQNTLSNLFAGLHILASKDLNPGDFVRLEGGEEGTIIDIKWRNTSILALSNWIIVVPNSKLADMKVINFSLPQKESSIVIEVGVARDSDLEKVEMITVDTAVQIMNKVPGAVQEFHPFIRYHSIRDYSVNFSVILRVKDINGQYLIKHEFIKLLQRNYAENGIALPVPEQKLEITTS